MYRLLPPLPSAAQMRAWDAEAINFGLPDALLMENASRSTLKLLSALCGPIKEKKFLFFMGGGNNGGDAVCLARILHDQGCKVLVAHSRPLEDLKGAARFHADLAVKDEVPLHRLEAGNFPQFLAYLRERDFLPDVLVDGLVGVSLHGELSPDMSRLINDINFFAEAARAFMLALDVPSGLNADTGLPMPIAIRARATACMAFAKKGEVLPQAKPYIGSLYVCDIGMPQVLASSRVPDLYLLDGRLLLSQKSLPENSYKNIYGHVTVIGGQAGLSGAARLASLAALRSGAGLVTACAPPDSLPLIKGNLPELMTLGLGHDDAWPESLPASLSALIKNSQALVIGPGMGRGENSKTFLYSLLALPDRPPCVLDADALFLLADNPEWKSLLREKDVLTPHPGEAARLLKCSTADLERDRLQALTRLMENLKAAVILKGVNTLIGQGALPALICPYDIPQMAIGGAGDVLAGCLGALLSQKYKLEAINLTCAQAVMRHVCAGMICASQYPQRGALASDLAEALAHTQKFLEHMDTVSLQEGLLPWPR